MNLPASSTLETNAIDYGQAKSRSVHRYSGNTDSQTTKNNMVAKETVRRSKASNSSTSFVNEAMWDLATSDAAVPPLSHKFFSPLQRPGTASLPETLASSLPDVQPRPSSAPACSSATDHPDVTPSFRPSTTAVPLCSITSPDVPINIPLKEEPDADRSGANRRNAVSMSGMMGLGTRQTIASSILPPTATVPFWVQGPSGQRMPQVCNTQVNGDYPHSVTGAVPPTNYNMFGMVNVHTTPSARRGGFPFFVPQQLQPATVPQNMPQNLPGHVSQAANAYVPGFPTFVPTPINSNWGVSGHNPFPIMPCPNNAYPNFQYHASERYVGGLLLFVAKAPRSRQTDPTNKALNVPHGQQM